MSLTYRVNKSLRVNSKAFLCFHGFQAFLSRQGLISLTVLLPGNRQFLEMHPDDARLIHWTKRKSKL